MKKIIANVLLLIFSVSLSLIIAELVVRFFAPQNLTGSWLELSSKSYRFNKSLTTTRHQWGERIVYYRINSHHLRGPEINSQKFKVLAMGDSFTFGSLLEEKDTYVGILQKYTNDSISRQIQLINGGTSGWGTADFLDYLKDFGDKIHPDMIVIFMNSDDIARSFNRHLFFNPNSFSFKIKEKLSHIDFYFWLLEHSHLIQLCKNYLERKVILVLKRKW